MKCLINVRLYDYENYIENAYIIFNEKILEIGSMENFQSDLDYEDMEGRLIIPGLINGHTHIYSTLFRGLNLGASPTDFKDVLNSIWWRFDSNLTLEDIEYSAKVYAIESFKNGVTALIDHHASGEIRGSIQTLNKMLNEMKMKHLLCFESSDRYDLKDCIAENRMALDIGGHFGMHASLSLSDLSLGRISEYVGTNPIHIHVAEALVDEEDSLEKHGMRVIERLDKFNLLHEDSILAHCIHIDDHEADLISKKGCQVALNTTSNLNNAVGLYNYSLLKKYNIPILVGTDGLGCNVSKEYQSLYYVGKMGMGNPSGVDFDWVRESIVNSYGYFSRRYNEKIGLLKKDYCADFLVVDYMPPTPMVEDNAFAHIFYGVFENLKPKDVYVGGDLVICNYQYQDELFYNMKIPENLWERIGGYDEFKG